MQPRQALIVVLMLLAAACGSGDADREDTSGGGDAQVTTTAVSADPGDGGSGGATDDPGETPSTSAAPGSGETALANVLPDSAPDPSTMTPTDQSPGFDWILVLAYATATAGRGTLEFSGTDPIWGTDQNPLGSPQWFDTAAACTFFELADQELSVQASFHHVTERNLHSSFSMSDNGDGTVIWGLYNAESGEEWSATGPGSASIRYAIPTGSDEQYDWFWDSVGWPSTPEHVYMIIDFEGPAGENFSTDKSDASSRVLCLFARRP